MKKAAPKRRGYAMGARAESVRATTDRILSVAAREFTARPYDEVSLAAIAEGSGVAVQTLLRRWGSKEGLLDATATAGAEAVRAARSEAPAGDVEGAIGNLVEHYETWGDRMTRLLAQEDRVPALRRVTDGGRQLHHGWVERVFSPWLEHETGAARARLRAQLVAVTDLYVWKILRRDLGLDRAATELSMRELALGLVGRARRSP